MAMEGSNRIQLYDSRELLKYATSLFEQHCHQLHAFGNLTISHESKPQQIIHIDTTGGFAGYHSSKRYLHFAIDAFSRYLLTGNDPDGIHSKEELHQHRQLASDNTIRQHKYDKERHDKRHPLPNLQAGDKVMLQTKSKIN